MPTGQFDLHITNTSQVDAGTYTCVDVVSHDNASAIYAVLGRLYMEHLYIMSVKER